MSAKAILQVTIVDDHKIFTEGLKLIFSHIRGFKIIGIYHSGESFMLELSSNIPDVLFIDLRLPGLNGVDITKRVLSMYPKIRVVAVTMCDELHMVQEIFKAGAKGYITKGSSTQELKWALESMKRDTVFVSPDIAKKLEKHDIDINNLKVISIKDQFSKRQRTILQFMGANKTNKEIAEVLDLSERTIENEKKRIGERMGVSKSAAMVAKAYDLGLLP